MKGAGMLVVSLRGVNFNDVILQLPYVIVDLKNCQPIHKLQGTWVLPSGLRISTSVWVASDWLLVVFGYHKPVITKACQLKPSQKIMHGTRMPP